MCHVITASPNPADASIDKSGKKFAPKAPARRAPGPPSTQGSTRPSVDRQFHAQTPQPQSSQRFVASSPTPSVFLSQNAPAQQPATTADVKASHRDEATPISFLSRSSSAPKHVSTIPVVSQRRLSSPSEPRRRFPPVSQSVIDSIRAPESSGSLSTPHETIFGHIGHYDVPVPSSTGLQNRGVAETTGTDVLVPAPKRRRVEDIPENNRTDTSHAPIAIANVPIPSTETDETVPKSHTNSLAPTVSNPSARAKKPRPPVQEKKRKQQIKAAAAEVVAIATTSPSAKVKRPRKNTKWKGVQRDKNEGPRSNARTPQEALSQAEENIVASKPKRRDTKRVTQQSIEDAAAGIVKDAVLSSSRDPKVRNRRRNRAPTPEGAETVQIMPSEVRMMDLCRDGGTGRKSEREKELEELQRAEFIRKKQSQLREVMGEGEPEIQATPLKSMEERQERLERQREHEANAAHNVPNTIIVNGQIQVDESSLEIDRHAAAALERDAEQLDAVDETDMTRKINSATWLRRDKSGGWNEMLTERFYDGLRMFGTDFEMISKMFPGRTRHKIKLKFCREEKINGIRIKATLLGEKLAVDLPELEKMAGTEFNDPEELEKDLEEDRIRLQEETAAEKQAMDEAKRERQEQIAAEQVAAENDSSAKENRHGKGKKKRSKRKRGENGERKTSKKNDNRAQMAANACGREPAEASGVET